MAVSKHPSVAPGEPRKPPATHVPGEHSADKEKHSGQTGVPYGFKHEFSVHPSHKSERAHDFHDHAGDERGNDEPG